LHLLLLVDGVHKLVKLWRQLYSKGEGLHVCFCILLVVFQLSRSIADSKSDTLCEKVIALL
jgi:hypothetical protein